MIFARQKKAQKSVMFCSKTLAWKPRRARAAISSGTASTLLWSLNPEFKARNFPLLLATAVLQGKNLTGKHSCVYKRSNRWILGSEY